MLWPMCGCTCRDVRVNAHAVAYEWRLENNSVKSIFSSFVWIPELKPAKPPHQPGKGYLSKENTSIFQYNVPKANMIGIAWVYIHWPIELLQCHLTREFNNIRQSRRDVPAIKEYLLLFWRIQVLFPAPLLGSSHPPVTPPQVDLTPSFDLEGHTLSIHSQRHTYMYT